MSELIAASVFASTVALVGTFLLSRRNDRLVRNLTRRIEVIENAFDDSGDVSSDDFKRVYPLIPIKYCAHVPVDPDEAEKFLKGVLIKMNEDLDKL